MVVLPTPGGPVKPNSNARPSSAPISDIPTILNPPQHITVIYLTLHEQGVVFIVLEKLCKWYKNQLIVAITSHNIQPEATGEIDPRNRFLDISSLPSGTDINSFWNAALDGRWTSFSDLSVRLQLLFGKNALDSLTITAPQPQIVPAVDKMLISCIESKYRSLLRAPFLGSLALETLPKPQSDPLSRFVVVETDLPSTKGHTLFRAQLVHTANFEEPSLN
jgi:hypothetical protein